MVTVEHLIFESGWPRPGLCGTRSSDPHTQMPLSLSKGQFPGFRPKKFRTHFGNRGQSGEELLLHLQRKQECTSDRRTLAPFEQSDWSEAAFQSISAMEAELAAISATGSVLPI